MVVTCARCAVMRLQECGLPVFPAVGGRPDLVRDALGLQGFREFLVTTFREGFAIEQPLQALVSALQGWEWAPAAADCPIGALRYPGAGSLPPRTTVDPAAATTAFPAQPVGREALPAWQRPLWDSSPLRADLFDRLSAADVDRDFLMGVVSNGVLLVPDLQPFAVPRVSPPPLSIPWALCLRGMAASGSFMTTLFRGGGGVWVNDYEVYVRYTWDSLDLAVRYLVSHAFMGSCTHNTFLFF